MSGELSHEESASWLKKVTNSWITPLLRRGAKEVLTPDVIWRASEDHLPDVEAVEIEMKRATLFRALVIVFRREWLSSAAWRVVQLAILFLQPFLVRSFVQFLSTDKGDLKMGLLLAFSIGFVPMIEMVFLERAIWLNEWTSQRIRTLLVLLVNRKVLTMRRGGGGEIDTGVLLQVDADRVAQSAEHLHFLWRMPMNLLISLSVLTLLLGPLPALAAFGAVMVVVAISLACNRRFSALKRRAAVETDGE